MNADEEITGALQEALTKSQLILDKVERDLRKLLPPDFAEQAQELENREVLERIKQTETTKIREIKDALARRDAGTYGICTKCGAPIDPRRLKAHAHTLACVL